MIEQNSNYISPSKKAQSHQFKALLRKNISLQLRQPCTNICQILTPIICILFTSLIKTAITGILPDPQETFIQKYPFVPFSFNNYTLENMFPDFVSRHSLQWFSYNVENKTDQTFFGDFSLAGCSGMLCNIKQVASIDTAQFNNSITPPFVMRNSSCPFFQKTANKTVNEDLFDRIVYLSNEDMSFIKKSQYQQLDKMADGGIYVRHASKQQLDLDLKINDLRQFTFHRVNGITAISLRTDENMPYLKYFTISEGMLSLVNLLNAAYIYTLKQKIIHSGYMYMPLKQQFSTFINMIINTVCSILFPLSLSLLFPVFLYLVVLQKQQKLIQMMRMNGMSMKWYWFVNFLFNFVISVITNVIFCLAGFLFIDQGLFHGTSWLILTIILLGWILAQIGMSVFFQAFLSSSRSANIIGYLLSIWTCLIGSTLSVALYQYPAPMPVFATLYPTFAFNRLMYTLFSECSADHCISSFSDLSPEMIRCIWVLYVAAIILYALGMYLFQILPQQYGVRQSIFFPIKSIVDTFKQRESKMQQTEEDNSKQPNIDQLSKEIKDQVMKIENPEQFALICSNLKKIYSNGKLAVNNLNFYIKDRQIFGLLGPNGAGKTTLISMFAGIFSPTQGKAYISGYSILNQINHVHLNMGICPQFDILWPDLTVEQHLLFYARLKGIESNEENKKVEEALQEVNLKQFRKFYSKKLSGGMKRRLSVGIGLVGDPRIIFLDQPTTGLDPENRRQLWQVLAKLKQKRSLLLTTHLMQEADTLCNRIGIITDGSIRTIGAPLLLKKMYGNGYFLTINLDNSQEQILNERDNRYSINQEQDPSGYSKISDSEIIKQSLLSHYEPKINDTIALEETFQNKLLLKKSRLKSKVNSVKEIVSEMFPNCITQRQINGSVKFRLGDIKISEALSQLYANNNQQIKNGWAISNSNLEDVFINVVKKYDKEAYLQFHSALINEEEIIQNPKLFKENNQNNEL